MKKFAFLGFALAVLLVSVPAVAQQEPLTVDELIELVRSDVQKDKVAIMGAAMGFTADEAAKFWPIYEGYEAELAKVGDRRVMLIKDYAENFTSMTDDKANALAEGAMGIEAQRMELKHAAFEKISKEISPVVGARFLQVENQINLLLDIQLAQQMPLIEKP